MVSSAKVVSFGCKIQSKDIDVSASVSCKSWHGNGDIQEKVPFACFHPHGRRESVGVEGLLGLRCRISQISIIVIGISDIKNPFGLDLVLFVATCKILVYIGDSCGVYQLKFAWTCYNLSRTAVVRICFVLAWNWIFCTCLQFQLNVGRDD